MSKSDEPGGGCGGRRTKTKSFKGVENFLKRVAFNLGNSPSQTEVKIISCIPIDVSDLQQKIIYLEKQLEDNLKCAACQNRDSQKQRYVNTALCETKYPPFAHTGICCNALDMEKGTDPCPINSEEQFDGDQSRGLSFSTRTNKKSKSAVDTNRYADANKYADILPYAFDSTNFIAGDVKPRPRKNFFKKKKKCLRYKKNKAHYVYYAQTSGSPFEKYKPNGEPEQDPVMTRSYLTKMIKKQYRPKMLGGNLSQNSTFSSPVCRDVYSSQEEMREGYNFDSDFCSCCHGEYQNIDVRSFNPQVFRANEIITSRYNDSSLYDLVPVKEKSAKVRKTSDPRSKPATKPTIDMNCWPGEVRTRLYATKLRTYPYLSYETVPLMTDNHPKKSTQVNNRESKNIAKRNPERNKGHNVCKNTESSKSCYVNFDSTSNQPGLVPCPADKHRPLLIMDEMNDNEAFSRQTHTATAINHRRIDANKCSGNQVSRHTDAQCLTTIINNSECQTFTNTDVKASNTSNERTEVALNQIRSILESVLHEVKVTNAPKVSTNREIDKKDAIVQKGTSDDNVASVLPTKNANNSPATLQNDFVSAMQSTMPTNTSSNMQGSRLLHSFTYSPYNMDPFMPSCSKQISCNQYNYPSMGMRCFQNFPLFIQGQSRRHMCATCYRHSGQIKSSYGRKATTTATNTDDVKEHSKETDNLIREIYKSMALHMGMPTKDMQRDDELQEPNRSPTKKESEKPHSPNPEVRKVSNVVHVVSELFRKKDILTSESHNSSGSKSLTPYTTNESREINEVSTGSHVAEPVDEVLQRARLKKFLYQKQGREQRQEKRMPAKPQKTVTTSESEASYNDSSTPVPSVPLPQQRKQKEQKEKKGLFTKMLNSVKLFKPRDKKKRENKKANLTKKPEPSKTEETLSDSDDYQTIYSQRLEPRKSTPRSRNLGKRRTHSKISYKQMYAREKTPDRLVRIPPYRQNYQRSERGRVIFENKYYHPYSLPYSSESSERSPYYQTYEARHVAVPRFPELKPSKVEFTKTVPIQNKDPKLPAKGLAWLKKHKMLGLRCAPQWKRLILEG